jgi:hypothetical protein
LQNLSHAKTTFILKFQKPIEQISEKFKKNLRKISEKFKKNLRKISEKF